MGWDTSVSGSGRRWSDYLQAAAGSKSGYAGAGLRRRHSAACSTACGLLRHCCAFAWVSCFSGHNQQRRSRCPAHCPRIRWWSNASVVFLLILVHAVPHALRVCFFWPPEGEALFHLRVCFFWPHGAAASFRRRMWLFCPCGASPLL